MLRALRTTRAASLRICTTRLPRRNIGAGYTGEREAGYDEAAMNELRAHGDKPFTMLNLLKIVDRESWDEYLTRVGPLFNTIGAENLYSGLMRGAPVPVKANDIDTSDYNLVLLNRFPSADAFFKFIDHPEYQAAYPFRLKAFESGKSSLIVTYSVKD